MLPIINRKTKNQVFVVTEIESERGWGQRIDGYLAFVTEAAADKFINREYSTRKENEVPDFYVRYEKQGLIPCSSKFFNKLKNSSKKILSVDSLGELSR